MGPQDLRIGGGLSYSNVHPAVVVIWLIAIALILVLPRKYVAVPILFTIFLTPFGQVIYVSGVHIFTPQILILFGWIRLMSAKLSQRTEIVSGGFTSIDKIFLAWALFRTSATFLEFLQVQAALNQIAFLWSTVGGYFLLRFLIRDDEDILRVLKTFALIACILAFTMTGERLFDRNVFGYIGGRLISPVREGALRALGTFEGPIQAGTVGATLLCLFAWLWQSGKSRLAGIAGMIGSAIMVVTSASSTPLLTVLAGMLAISLWPVRKFTRIIRWGMVVLLILLQAVMKAPVWFLINHVDLVAGNSGYHRAMLIDQLVRHFSEWWLIGVKSTAGWGWDMWDQANQFVTEGETGGLATLVCFVLMVSWLFGRLGRARKIVEGDRNKEWMFWLFGGALFSYVVSFFGISFSDQSWDAWFVLLAIICAATTPVLALETSKDVRARLVLPATQLSYTPAPRPLARSTGNRRLDSGVRVRG